MRIWKLRGIGEPREQLMLCAVDEPEPGPQEVAVRVEAIGLAYPDVLQCRGLYQEAAGPGFTPGRETAGVVAAVGREVTGLSVGDPVMVVGGGLAEVIVQPAELVFRRPASLSAVKAAAIPTNYLTTWYALHDRAALQAKEWLLVSGASGGTGTAAIQLGVAAGARVLALTGGDERAEFCRGLGAHEVIDYHVIADWVDLAREITGGGANVAFDPVGGETFHQIRRAMAFDGRLLVVGFVAGIPQAPLNHVLLKNYAVVGVHWGASLAHHSGSLARQVSAVLSLAEAGQVDPPIFQPYTFEQAATAMDDLAARRTHGKVVVRTGLGTARELVGDA